MKYKLSADDKTRIANVHEYDIIINYLKHKDKHQFKVGDILIKQFVDYDDDDKEFWDVEHVSDKNKVPRKYLYAHEDEYGVGYVKVIGPTGKPGKGLTPLTECSLDSERFALDPDLVDHVLLADEGEEFDATAAYKRRKNFRAKALKANKKIMLKMANEVDKVKFLETLKVGDHFWMGYNIDDMVTQEYEVTKISGNLVNNGGYWNTPEECRKRWEEVLKKNPKLKDIKLKQYTLKTIRSQYPEHVGDVEIKTYENLQNCICMTPPFALNEDIP